MQFNGRFWDYFNMHPAILPVDLEAGAASGICISLKGYAWCDIVLFKKAGTAGDDPIFTLTQATAVAGTGEKALPIPANRIASKLHATTVPGLFTDVNNAAISGGTYTDDTAAEKSGMIICHINAEDLDVANSFDCIRLAIPDTGSAGAELGSAFYILGGPRYAGASMISPITD